MIRGVPAVAVEVGQVDATDECDPVIDHDRFLVVAVHGTLPRVQRDLDASAVDQPLADPPHVTSPWAQHRERSAGPDQNADRDSGRHLGQQPLERRWPLAADELEVRRDVPAGDVHMRPRCGHRLGHGRQRRRAIDQHLEGIAGPGWRIALSPTFRRRFDRPPPTDAVQPPSVM